MYQPDFLIIGSMKSGTTTLHADLRRQPAIGLPDPKESWILTSSKTVKDVRRKYKRYYKNVPSNRLKGDATTGYAFAPTFPGVPKLAAESITTNLKLLYIVRDPLDRTLSHIRHDLMAGRINKENLAKVVDEDPRYVLVSDYCFQLGKWLEYFPAENIYCVSFENYIENRDQCLRNICDFLSVEGYLSSDEMHEIHNAASNKFGPPNILKRISRFSFYQHKIRPFLPKIVSNTVKSALYRKQTYETFQLDEEMQERLTEKMRAVPVKFSQFLEDNNIKNDVDWKTRL